MSLLKKEKRDLRRQEKAEAKQLAESQPDGASPEVAAKPSRGLGRLFARLNTPIAYAWLFNLLLIAWLCYAWVGKYAADMRAEQLAQEVAYRVSRFTGEVSYMERRQNVQATFMLPVGEAPYLMRGDLRQLWEEPPRDDIAFLWQNDHFARHRGVVIVSSDRELLQSVDALLDDGDLGNGLAQMHPRGLWVSLM